MSIFLCLDVFLNAKMHFKIKMTLQTTSNSNLKSFGSDAKKKIDIKCKPCYCYDVIFTICVTLYSICIITFTVTFYKCHKVQQSWKRIGTKHELEKVFSTETIIH